MPEYLDVSNWARRDLFEFFIEYQNPYFNICTRLEVTALLALLRERPEVNVSLTYHYCALRVANEMEPFRYRLRERQVLIHDKINGGTTVLRPNESFTLVYFDYEEDFEKFIAQAEANINDAKSGNSLFKPSPDDAKIHFTTFPWAAFTSFAHARNPGRADSVPKIAFGKFVRENERTFLPISVEVHHALMDGLHVGRYLIRLEELFAEPSRYLMSVT
jgi:chloramphenicol O-acetyltransferase type A